MNLLRPSRDSLIYYILLALLELGVSILWHSGPNSLLQLMVGISLAVPVVLCSKLILNLREAYYGHHADRAYEPTTGVGSSRGTTMLRFSTNTHRSTASQPPGHDKESHVIISQKTADLYNDDEWAATRFNQ